MWGVKSGRAALRCVAFVLLVLPLPARTEELRDPMADVQVTELSNGLTVLTLEDHTSPVVSLQVWTRVGSKDEARFTGLAHLFEHMMFRGSKNLGPEGHQKLVEARGGRINAFTSSDVTVYFEDVTSEHLPLMIALEAERLAHLDISEESLTSEREVVIEERRMRTEDDPQGRAFEALMALSFMAHPYRRPTIGWRSDLEQVGVAECREFFQTYYAANNLVLAIAGDFETDDALRLVRQHMGRLLPASEIPRNPTTEPEQRGERRAVIEFDVRAPLLTMAWHAPPTGHPDAEALDVTSAILSSGRTSRLYRALVYDEPIALAAVGSYWELERAGLFFASVQVRPGSDIDRAEDVFLREVARVRDEPVSEAELAKAIRSLEVGLIRGQGTAHALAMRMGREWVSFGRIRSLEERLAAIRAVSVADVQRVAQTYLPDAGRNVVHVIPKPEAEGGAP
jgi:zinc protease